MFRRKKTYKEYTDEALCLEYRNNQQPQFIGLLFERYKHLVYGLCLKYLKNEADSQDALIGIFEKLHKDLKHHEPRVFKAWLYMLSKNFCLNILRKKQQDLPKHEAFQHHQSQTNDVEENPYEKELRYEQLEEAILQLKEPQQSCIRMFFLEKKCYKEIAHITDLSLKKVKSSIQNGKRNLKIILSKVYENKY